MFDSVLALLVDGARPDVLAQMAAAGELPTVKKHFFDAGGYRAVTSVFPTVSGPAHLPLLTGLHPGQANLPGIRWAVRPQGRRGFFLGRTRSYMSPFRAPKLERDIPRGVTTFFHHVQGMADVNTWFVRGCASKARLTRFSKGAAFVRSLVSKDWYSSDLQAEAAVKVAFDRGFPSAFAVFPAVDELGHRFGPLCDESYEAYRRFDAALGRIVDHLHKRGQLDRTLIAITSDHGQSGTHTHVDLDDLVSAIYPRTLAYPRLWRALFDAEAAVMVSGNAMANVYVRGDKGWHERPSFDGGRGRDLVCHLLQSPAIDHVIYRREAAVFVVENPEGKLVVDARQVLGESPSGESFDGAATLRFAVEGKNPLGYGPLPAAADRRLCHQLTKDSAYPDAPWQLAEFYRSHRAGDLLVCARPGFDLRSRFEYQPHRGSHGGLHRDHMMIPALVNARWSGEPLSAVDLFPSVMNALGKPVPEGLTGTAIPLSR